MVYFGLFMSIHVYSGPFMYLYLPAYTRRQIKNDQPGSHDFRRFLCQF